MPHEYPPALSPAQNIAEDGALKALQQTNPLNEASRHAALNLMEDAIASREALYRSEEQLRLFVTASSETVYRMSGDWSTMRVLEGRTLLASTEGPIDGWLEKYIPPDEQLRVKAAIDEAICRKRTFELEHQCYAIDGRIVWVFSRAIPLLDDKGEVREWFGAASDITAQRRSKEALRKSEEKYRTLFNSIDEGFCIIEVLFDPASGKAFDYRFLEANPAFEKQTGLVNAVGRTIREFAPAHEEFWYEIYAHVAKTGEPARFEQEAAAIGHFYDVYAFRIGDPGQNRVAVLFRDIAERKQQEKRQIFLLKLADSLRMLTDPVEVQNAAMKLLVEELGVMRASYFELEADQDAFTLTTKYERDAFPMPDRMRLSDFGPEMADAFRAGRTLIFRDTETDTQLGSHPRAYRSIGIRAWMAVPLVKNGRLLAILGVHSATPRDWMGTEARLLEEVAERTWAAVERARAETALRASETRYRLLFESIDESFAIIEMIRDEDGKPLDYRVLEANPAFAAHTGLADFIGRTARELVPNLEPEWVEVYGAIAASGEAKRFTQRVAELNRVYDVFAFPIGERWQQRVAVLASDVSVREQAQEILRANEERLQIMADAVPQLIWASDSEGAANYFNKRWREFTGLTSEQLVEHGWQAAIHPDDAPTALAEWNRVVAAGENFEGEYRLRGADGTYHWFIARIVPLHDSGGRITRWFGTATDIDDLKRAKSALEKGRTELWEALQETERARADAEIARGAAEAAGKAKNHFLAVLSHELRTPLTPIAMAAQAFGRRKDLPEPVRDAMGMIARNVKLECRLVDDLLDITRIERGKMELQLEPVDMQDVVKHAVETTQQDMEAKRQKLILSLEATNIWIKGDSGRLQQVIWNLLRNASKFTPSEGTITVRTWNESDQICVVVSDTGIGIEAEALPRIFEAFTQANASITRQYGGLGLGLSITRAILRAHAGELRVASDGKNRGATFTVSLPLLKNRSVSQRHFT